MTVRFTLDVFTPFSLNGVTVIPVQGVSAGLGERLVNVSSSTDVFSQFITSNGGSITNLSGILAAGTYDFIVTWSATTPGPGSSSSNVNVPSRELVIPTPTASALLVVGGLVAARRRRN